MKRFIPCVFLSLGILFTPVPPEMTAQSIAWMEFRNQPITDILMALADIAGKSIVPDETVTGSASYYFSNTQFDEAFQVFLSSYKLYSREEKGVIYVSRIGCSYDKDREISDRCRGCGYAAYRAFALPCDGKNHTFRYAAACPAYAASSRRAS